MPALAALLICLPWLNPFSPGPLAQTAPLLFAWACGAGVLLMFALDHQRGQHDAMVRALVWAWALAAALSSAIGLLQYVGATAWAGVWLNHTQIGTAFGNLRQRNQFATLLNLGVAAALWLAATSARNTQPVPDQPTAFIRHGAVRGWPAGWTGPLAWLPALLAGLLSVGNAASASRTGLFQLLLVWALTSVWLRGPVDAKLKKRLQTTLWVALIAYAVALLVLPQLIGLDPSTSGALARLRSGDAECASRLTLWNNVLHLVTLRPWLGWGWGELDYAHFITLYPGPRFCDILDNAHNLPLQLAVELGVPVALLLCVGVGGLAWRARPWQERHPTRQLAWAMLAVILLHSLLEYPLWYGPFQIAAMLALWLLGWVDRPLDVAQENAKNRLLVRVVYGLLAIFILAYCGVAAWNYRIASQIYLNPDERAPAFRSHTLEKSQGVWLYQDSVRFADLTTSELDAGSAARLNALAKQMLHFSPEARVVELLLDSARWLGQADDVAFYTVRFQAAFPQDYAAWRARASGPPGPDGRP